MVSAGMASAVDAAPPAVDHLADAAEGNASDASGSGPDASRWSEVEGQADAGAGGCAEDRDCVDGQRCETDAGQCVRCLLETNRGCSAERYCWEADTGNRSCVECIEDEHCEGNPAGPACWQQKCVACLSPAEGGAGDAGGAEQAVHCPSERPWCRTEPGEPLLKRCVACLSDGDCGPQAPICDATGTCVGCTQSADCAAWAPELGQCDPQGGNCVACTADEHCGDPSAARCDLQSNQCVPCETSESCTGIAGKSVCFSGSCVECSVQDETPCGVYSCLPDTNTCSETPRGSRGLCESCAADSECVGGAGEPLLSRCVPLQFPDRASGGYCLRRAAAGCPSYIYEFPVESTSVSGAVAEVYCGVSEGLTSCEAVLDLANSARSCASGEDEACGCARDARGECTNEPSGGLCRAVGLTENRCTYPCGSPSQCPLGYDCTTEKPWCH